MTILRITYLQDTNTFALFADTQKPKSSFSLIDLGDFIDDEPVVKIEGSKAPVPKARVPTTRQKSSALKKRKTSTSADTESFSELNADELGEKLKSFASLLDLVSILFILQIILQNRFINLRITGVRELPPEVPRE